MPRLPRIAPPGYPAHVIARGNNRYACFHSDADIANYVRWLKESTERFGVDVHGWVIMSNHVHLLLTPQETHALSKTMQHIGRQYVRYYNRKYQRTGTLFEGRFKSCLIADDRYLLTCLRYIELNPVRAGMVKRPRDFHWSSYSAHAGETRPSMWVPHPTYLALGKNSAERATRYQRLFDVELTGKHLADIRSSINRGEHLGEFAEQKGRDAAIQNI